MELNLVALHRVSLDEGIGHLLFQISDQTASIYEVSLMILNRNYILACLLLGHARSTMYCNYLSRNTYDYSAPSVVCTIFSS